MDFHSEVSHHQKKDQDPDHDQHHHKEYMLNQIGFQIQVLNVYVVNLDPEKIDIDYKYMLCVCIDFKFYCFINYLLF